MNVRGRKEALCCGDGKERGILELRKMNDSISTDEMINERSRW